MSTVTILGAGVMGSAMCMPLSDRGHAVRLAGTHLDAEIIDSVKATGRHPKLNVKLPDGVTGYQHDAFAKALGSDTDLLILGISSAGVNWAIDRLCETLKAPVPVVMITKGMHPEEQRLAALPGRVAAEVKRRTGIGLRIAAIGGPCIAGELAVRRQTGTVITSHDLPFAQSLCDMLECEYYHPRLSPDVIGVEICAAFKNFFAIGVGWAAGRLEKMAATENRAFNHNAAAIIFDQAIRELMVLVRAHGGAEASVWGMPGAGDLYVTAQAGRNSRLGNNLGRGLTYSQTKDGPMKGDTIEGAELGVTVAKTLRAMMAAGALDARSLPLTTAILDALTHDTALDIPWAAFHRM
ncbi:MAG: glycerol-3-phosphate dehydrogenase [Aestuariivirga sp.]|uniref:glycerol-3-phosphate dehydrogenase n=1 Tax=Aestuariivirga sp. TaxID=2650926 RepID=UPI0025BA7D2F|nr:glycerol-3-phosphate dehydrogenase [Aestuariivirga sp.]MCA3560022.1 glycerol-3-phosphate dehydrogenase [Aestuariivirga sp.]